MSYKTIAKIISIVFGFFGVVGIAVAALFIVKSFNVNKEYVKVNARITEVYDEGCAFTYTYDGETYNRQQFTYTSSSFREGKTIKIYVRPDDPASYKLAAGYTVGIIVGGAIGLVFMIISIAVYPKRGKTRVNSNWQCITANVCDVQPNLNCLINGCHPFKVVCKYDYMGKEVRFYSKNCIDDPGDVYMPNEEIKVYIKDDTMKRYKVDLSKFYDCGMR